MDAVEPWHIRHTGTSRGKDKASFFRRCPVNGFYRAPGGCRSCVSLSSPFMTVCLLTNLLASHGAAWKSITVSCGSGDHLASTACHVLRRGIRCCCCRLAADTSASGPPPPPDMRPHVVSPSRQQSSLESVLWFACCKASITAARCLQLAHQTLLLTLWLPVTTSRLSNLLQRTSCFRPLSPRPARRAPSR